MSFKQLCFKLIFLFNHLCLFSISDTASVKSQAFQFQVGKAHFISVTGKIIVYNMRLHICIVLLGPSVTLTCIKISNIPLFLDLPTWLDLTVPHSKCLLQLHYEASSFTHLQHAETQSLIQGSEILSRMSSLEVKHGITVHYFKALC